MKAGITLALALFCGALSAQVTTLPTNYSLNPYTGTWSEKEAAHLLRRTLYGPTYTQIQDAVTNGMNTTVNNLFSVSPVGVPLSYHVDEAVAAIGDPWNNEVYPPSNTSATDNARRRSLKGWMVENLMEDNNSLQQKMVILWHNLFGVTECFDARATYDYVELIYSHALGNVKTMVREMTSNPSMLQFLNGNTNTGNNPNENYAREFLELYTVGKDDLIGVGDYSHYTEQDVTEGAKIFSGFRTYGFRSSTIPAPYAAFDSTRHDTSSKTLSYHFSNATVAHNGKFEYQDFIDLVFASSQFGDFVCEEIYRYFVGTRIDQTISDSIIAGMKTTLLANNFDIQPVLDQLLKSQHFYDVALRGSLMKNPSEFIFSIYNGTGSVVDFDFDSDRIIWYYIYRRLATEGMDLLNPPSVAGWDAYYQEPGYGKLWMSSVYYQSRTSFITRYVVGNGYNANGNRFKVDALGFLNMLSNPTDAVAVVDDMCTTFLPKDPSAADKARIKDVLTDGLPDFEWTIESSAYFANPTDPAVANPVSDRVKATLAAVFDLYLFQTF